MSSVVKRGMFPHCPYCDDMQDEMVQDYFAPGKEDLPLIEQCGQCTKSFVLVKVDRDLFNVSPKSEPWRRWGVPHG